MTGLLPPSHGVRNNGTFRLDGSKVTLAERLKNAGYATGAFVSAFVLDSRFGLDRGFATYDDRLPPNNAGAGASFRFSERRAPETLQSAAAWIARQTTPWFAWVHVFDPHAPYGADAAGSPGSDATRAYDREVASVDRALGRFFDGLGTGLDRTIVVVTGDHGESLGEHGESTHGLFAYEATLRVPLLVAGPGIGSRVVTETVGHADIAPTVLELVGNALDSAEFDGRSLVGLLSGQADADRPLYFESLDAALTRGWAPLTGVIVEGWKFIDLPIPELYNLRVDADEQKNLASVEADRAIAMSETLRRISDGPRRAAAAGAVLVDAEARAKLRSLGYVSGPAPGRPSSGPEDDPKRLLPLHVRFQRAADMAGHDPDAALREFRALIKERPTFAAAYEGAATLLLDLGRHREAVTLLSETDGRGVRSLALTERLGAALIASGEARRAVTLLEAAAPANPTAIDLHFTLALALAGAGELDRARDTLQNILRLDPTASSAWTNLGTINLQQGARREAQEAFERALEYDDGSVAAWKGLGAAVETTDPARAARAWERALALTPADYQLLARLAFLLAKSDVSRAAPYLERLIREAPETKFAAEKRTARALLNARRKPQ
jgi:arylsulfatase A-like enzyme/Tfp pilus assembly protein PilF